MGKKKKKYKEKRVIDKKIKSMATALGHRSIELYLATQKINIIDTVCEDIVNGGRIKRSLKDKKGIVISIKIINIFDKEDIKKIKKNDSDTDYIINRIIVD